MSSEDQPPQLLRDKTIEAFFLSLLLEVFFFFFKFTQRWLIFSWKMGASLFKYFSDFSKWAASSCLCSSVITVSAKEDAFFFSHALLWSYHRFNQKLNAATASLKRLSNETVLCVNISFTFLFCTISPFLPKILKEKINVAHVELGVCPLQVFIRPFLASPLSDRLASGTPSNQAILTSFETVHIRYLFVWWKGNFGPKNVVCHMCLCAVVLACIFIVSHFYIFIVSWMFSIFSNSVIYLDFCNICLRISLYWTSKINSSMFNWWRYRIGNNEQTQALLYFHKFAFTRVWTYPVDMCFRVSLGGLMVVLGEDSVFSMYRHKSEESKAVVNKVDWEVHP